jgi:hypothetical protein
MGLDPSIYNIRGKHDNHSTTDAVLCLMEIDVELQWIVLCHIFCYFVCLLFFVVNLLFSSIVYCGVLLCLVCDFSLGHNETVL